MEKPIEKSKEILEEINNNNVVFCVYSPDENKNNPDVDEYGLYYNQKKFDKFDIAVAMVIQIQGFIQSGLFNNEEIKAIFDEALKVKEGEDYEIHGNYKIK